MQDDLIFEKENKLRYWIYKNLIHPFRSIGNKFAVFRYKTKISKEISEIPAQLGSDFLYHDLNEERIEHWDERVRLVQASSENEKISKVENTGQIVDGHLVMYNGLKIHPYSYYGKPALNLLIQNNTVHEPQEEYVFERVLEGIKPNSLMVELGSFWSFYSMYFMKKCSGGRAILVEPSLENSAYGQYNLKLNNLKAEMHTALVSNKNGFTKKAKPLIKLDDFFKKKKIDFIDILHSDIQGAELDMLHGVEEYLSNQKIGYLFVSTHSNELHEDCFQYIKSFGYELITSINLDETYSFDGILIMKNKNYPGIGALELSKRI